MGSAGGIAERISRSERAALHSRVASPAPETVRQACANGLRYLADDRPGIRRVTRGSGFAYLNPHGRTIRDQKILSRIRSLAIPPAWTDVWICPLANGHLQATGRDARGRKQYRYHPDWKELRSGYKYHRLPEFGKVLVRIRRAVQRDLKAQELSRRKVLAAVVRVLEDTMIRVGCEEYARENDSYGLATMRCRHVDFARGRARLKFRGKSAQEQDLEISDPSVVKVIRKCHELSGHELFKYSEGGELRDVGSGDINDYIREVARAEFTAKDFRTWGGTVWAAVELAKLGYGRNVTQQKKRIVEAVKRVAARLGNRPATCRKYYIHPAVFDAFQQGTLHKHFSMGQSNGHYTATAPGKRKSSLTTDEKALLRLLREQEKRSKAKKRRRTRATKHVPESWR